VRILLLVVLVASCQPEHRLDPDTPAKPQLSAFPVAVQRTHRRMHERFAAARQIEYAIARGDLQGATASAQVIASLDEPGFLPAWQPYVTSVRAAAHQLELAADLSTAGVRFGALGLQCAACHEALGAKLALFDEPRPSTNPQLASRMVDHQWATMRMWEGLIASSTVRWQEGAHALTAMPSNIIAEADTRTFTGAVDDVARGRLLATRAQSAEGDVARADLLGTLLGTCAHCHAMLRDR